jgi:hypothetical protein
MENHHFFFLWVNMGKSTISMAIFNSLLYVYQFTGGWYLSLTYIDILYLSILSLSILYPHRYFHHFSTIFPPFFHHFFTVTAGLRPGLGHLSGPGAMAAELHAAPGDALPVHVTRTFLGWGSWFHHVSPCFSRFWGFWDMILRWF